MRPILLVGALGACAFACNGPPSGGAAIADVQVGCPTQTRSKLTLAGAEIPVEIRCSEKDGFLRMELMSNGAIFEQEIYKQSTDGFGLVNAAGTTFEPPIPLLKQPMRIGESWDWTGSTADGGPARKAAAKVSSAEERVFSSAGNVDAIRISVDLEMESGASTPAKRRLELWLAPKQGVIKRKFGLSSLREPGDKE